MTVPARTRRVLEWIFGIGLVGLGVIGLVLPVLQGVLLIVAGLAVLSRHSALAKRIHDGGKAVARRIRERLRRG